MSESKQSKQLQQIQIMEKTKPRHGREAGDDDSRNENSAPNYNIESIYGKNFFFQQRRGSLDLRSISQLDLERVVREVDIDLLQSYLENVTFCNLKEEDMRFLTDPLVVKVN